MFEDSQIETDCTGDTALLATPHPAFDAGRPCRTSQRNRQKQACAGIVAPQSPPCHPAGPWDACGWQSRGIARNEIGSHPGEAYAPFRSTAYRDFAWMSPIPFRCASTGVLRRRVAKAVSHLLLRSLCLVPLPLPPQLSTAGYRDPGQLQGASSLHTPVVAVRFLPPCLPLRLRKWMTVATQRFCFRQALRVVSQSQALCLPSENRIGEFARTLLLPKPARHPFETGTENAREDRHPLTHTYAHACA